MTRFAVMVNVLALGPRRPGFVSRFSYYSTG